MPLDTITALAERTRIARQRRPWDPTVLLI